MCAMNFIKTLKNNQHPNDRRSTLVFTPSSENIIGHSERVPPLHALADYWSFAFASDQGSVTQEINFDRKSVFERSFSDLIGTTNDELNGFILFLRSINHYNRLKFILDYRAVEDHLKSDKLTEEDALKRICAFISNYFVLRDNVIYESTDDDTLKIGEFPVDNEKYSVTLCQIKDFIWNLVEMFDHPAYLKSNYHYRYQRQVLRENSYGLNDFIYHEHALRHLQEFCEFENITPLLSFWLEADDFRYCLQTNAYDSCDDIILDAMSIYRKYISLQASYYLGFDEAIRAKIECSICPPITEESRNCIYKLSDDCFDQALWFVYNVIDKVYFKKFPSSDTYASFVAELTFLARQPARNSSVSGATSETSLEKLNEKIDKSTHKSLCLGRLDSLGRYIRNVDPFPTPGSSFKEMRKKFRMKNLKKPSHTDELKAEEFAKNFISDVVYRSTSSVLSVMEEDELDAS